MRRALTVLAVALAGAVFFGLELHVATALSFAVGTSAGAFLSVVLVFQALLLVGYLLVARSGVPGLFSLVAAAMGAAGLVMGEAAPGGDSVLRALVEEWNLLLVALAMAMILPEVLFRNPDTGGTFGLLTASSVGAAASLLLFSVAWSGSTPQTRAAGLAIAGLAAALAHVVGVRGSARGAPAPAGPARGILVEVGLAAGVATFWYMTVHQRIENLLPVAPELWAASLLLFLGSYALAARRWRGDLPLARTAAGAAVALAVSAEFFGGGAAAFSALGALVLGCLAAHVVLRRAVDRAPGYPAALGAAAGGLVAGILVLAVAPRTVGTGVQLLLAMGLLVALSQGLRTRRASAGVAILVVVVAGGFLLERADRRRPGRVVEAFRTPYGEYQVREFGEYGDLQHHYVLYHRGTIHGAQYTEDRVSDLPVAYYSRFSGLGIALTALEGREGPLRIGAVGLGVGAVATYAERGDTVRFVEIDGALPPFLESGRFHQLASARASTDITVGDGRAVLRREEAAGAPRYDVLVIDAFSGGDIPAHLLSFEAMELYARRLHEDGVLLMHLSNQFLDLRPAVYDAVRVIGGRAVLVSSRARGAVDPEVPSHASMPATWLVVSSDPRFWSAFRDASASLLADDAISIQDSRAVDFDGLGGWHDGAYRVWPYLNQGVAEREEVTGWRPGG